MKQILLIILLFKSADSFCQSKKVLNYFKDYIRLDAGSNYPANESDPRAIIVPSTTYAGDTSGLKFNNEYVAFRQDDVTGWSDPRWNFRFMHIEPVTVAEYREFQNYLRDSVFREKLYERVKDDKEAAKMLMLSKQVIAEMNGNPENRPKDFGYKDRKDNRSYFDLNWKYSLTPEKGWQAGLLSDYYLPKPEGFYGKREFDWKQVSYSYIIVDLGGASKKRDSLKPPRRRYIIEYESPVIINSFTWSSSSKSVNDETSVLGQVYTDLFPDQSIIGITGMQALAFCNWKGMQIEKELKKQGFPAWVTVTLPTISDLELLKTQQQLQVPEHDYTAQWRITVKEYKTFVKTVKDSLELELLYENIPSDNDAAMLLNHGEYYRCEDIQTDLDNVPFDPAQRDQNRKYFFLNDDPAIREKYRQLLTEKKPSGWSEHVYYRYFWIDAATKGFEPKFTPGPENRLYPEHYETAKQQKVESNPIGSVNDRDQHSGVRVFTNPQAFIIKEQTDVIQGLSIENQVDNELVKGLTYEQAKAFYNWKYPIHQAKQGDDWQQLVLPTKEQFEEVQSGGTAIVPAHALEFPTPVFHYVVHVTKDFSPKDDDAKIKLR